MEQDEQNIEHNKNIWLPDHFIDNRGTDDVIIERLNVRNHTQFQFKSSKPA